MEATAEGTEKYVERYAEFRDAGFYPGAAGDNAGRACTGAHVLENPAVAAAPPMGREAYQRLYRQ